MKNDLMVSCIFNGPLIEQYQFPKVFTLFIHLFSMAREDSRSSLGTPSDVSLKLSVLLVFLIPGHPKSSSHT